MNQTMTYSTKIKHYRTVFQDTVRLYRAAVDYLIDVVMEQWHDIVPLAYANERRMFVESLVHKTAGRPHVPYDFDARFYKLPSYLRRSAISEAIGAVSSYQSRLALWEAADPKTRGRRPGYPKAGFTYPAMYRGNMFRKTNDRYVVELKVFIRRTWDWITVELRKSDVDYIARHCQSLKECVPTLRKRGREWFLDFAFEGKVDLSDTPARDQLILAVDLGINNACTACVMDAKGTVFARRFLRLSKENDSLDHALGRLKKAQRSGAMKTPRLWAAVNGINDDIAVKTARFIVDTAVLYNCDVIVMEHLDTGHKVRGSKKQRLHFWKVKYVQEMVALKAHRCRMRISRVNAWGTSRLAFDGSGYVKRGLESERTSGNYSLCEFSTGKLYHCDLNASYNIGARYFVRELIKSLPATAGQRIAAKVPQCVKRSTCTLSTLLSLNAETAAFAA